jgi:hypothetical protein
MDWLRLRADGGVIAVFLVLDCCLAEVRVLASLTAALPRGDDIGTSPAGELRRAGGAWRPRGLALWCLLVVVVVEVRVRVAAPAKF